MSKQTQKDFKTTIFRYLFKNTGHFLYEIYVQNMSEYFSKSQLLHPLHETHDLIYLENYLAFVFEKGCFFLN